MLSEVFIVYYVKVLYCAMCNTVPNGLDALCWACFARFASVQRPYCMCVYVWWCFMLRGTGELGKQITCTTKKGVRRESEKASREPG